MNFIYTKSAVPLVDLCAGTAFHIVRQGMVFAYQGEYYMRIESLITGGPIENAHIINAVKLDDGAVKHFDNCEQVLIIPAKLMI